MRYDADHLFRIPAQVVIGMTARQLRIPAGTSGNPERLV